MPRFTISQARTGEGAHLTACSNLGAHDLLQVLPDLLPEHSVLLVAADGIARSPPAGATALGDSLVATQGAPARALLQASGRWARQGFRLAIVPALPDADRLRKCIPDALRPWDHERLGATCYGQEGRGFAQAGHWFADPEHRRRWLDASVLRELKRAGHGLPAGDATIVLGLPEDAGFHAELRWSGRREAFRLRRAFEDEGVERQWRIDRGEWKGEERRCAAVGRPGRLDRAIQWLASAAILALSVPVAVLLSLLLLTTRLSSISTTSRRSAPGS